ncbi:MAG: CoA transferase [Chloroflexota bacterium]|nr:CoA transferase [Chloroflexota bacterium]
MPQNCHSEGARPGGRPKNPSPTPFAPSATPSSPGQTLRFAQGDTGKATFGASKGKALEGIRIADFSWVAVGPITTKYFADHGAEVIRIESSTRPETLRRTPPYTDDIPNPNRAGYHANLNSSKYGVTLNLKHPKAIELAKKLVARSDIVTESFGPGVMARFGLGYEALASLKPDLIMMSLSMQGQTGPHAASLGYGNTLLHLVGLGHLTGWPDREPVGLGSAYTDFFAPHLACTILLATLDYRRRTGRGQYIDFSQYEASLHCLGPVLLDYTANGRQQVRQGNRHPAAAPHGAYRCRGDDRWCAIAIFSDQEWHSLCRVLGDPEWTRDPRFATLQARLRHQEELDQKIEEWTSQRTAEEVMETLQAAGVAAGVVQTAEDLHSDPQFQHRHHYCTLDHPEMGQRCYDSPSFRLSRTPTELCWAAPCLGQHNEVVFKDILGLSEEEYVALLLEGAFE